MHTFVVGAGFSTIIALLLFITGTKFVVATATPSASRHRDLNICRIVSCPWGSLVSTVLSKKICFARSENKQTFRFESHWNLGYHA